MCEGLCQFDGAELVGSAPVDAAATSTVSVQDSTISGSRSDEDIIVRDQASITYTNSQGTGGTTDAWIRLLSQRSLSTNIPNGSLDIYDMGWGKADWNDLTDENGYILLVEEGATNEHKRIVEWMDGNGVLHQEDASITLSISSSWGTFSTTIDAPTTTEGSIELALPEIAVTAVAPESTTAVANKSISGMVTVANTGEAPVSAVSIWCYVDDEVVETTQMVVSLEAGESKDVPFTWYMYEAGEAALTCKPLLPTALNDIADLVVDMSGSSSEPITWEYAEEVEEFPLIIWIVAVAGFMGLALMVAAQSRKQAELKTYETHEEATAEADQDHAAPTEEAESTVEDEVAPEEEEEQAPSSIYDLKEEDEI